MLPKEERLIKGSEIRKTTKGNRIDTPLLSIYSRTNQTGNKRLVVICRKEIGGAVIRNKTRRALIAGYQIIKHKIDKNLDIVIMPRKAIKGQRAAEKALLDGISG